MWICGQVPSEAPFAAVTTNATSTNNIDHPKRLGVCAFQLLKFGNSEAFEDANIEKSLEFERPWGAGAGGGGRE